MLWTRTMIYWKQYILSWFLCKKAGNTQRFSSNNRRHARFWKFFLQNRISLEIHQEYFDWENTQTTCCVGFTLWPHSLCTLRLVQPSFEQSWKLKSFSSVRILFECHPLSNDQDKFENWHEAIYFRRTTNTGKEKI